MLALGVERRSLLDLPLCRGLSTGVAAGAAHSDECDAREHRSHGPHTSRNGQEVLSGWCGFPHRWKQAGPISVLCVRRESGGMKRILLISAVVFGILLLAVGGWTVRGVRWAVTG